MATARVQLRHLAIAAHDQPVSVVLDFVHPIGPGRWSVGNGRNAGLDEAGRENAPRDHQSEIDRLSGDFWLRTEMLDKCNNGMTQLRIRNARESFGQGKAVR
jgi:hypothetical protein